MPELEPDGRVIVDPEEIAREAATKIAQELAGLDPEAHSIVHRTLHRLSQLAALSIGADQAQLAQIRVERQAAIATLASLGEEKAARISKALLASLSAVLTLAIDALMDRIPVTPNP